MGDQGNTLLGPLQRKVVAWAICFCAVWVIAGLGVLAFWQLTVIVERFSGVIWPLAVAGILTLLLQPVVNFFEEKLRLSRVKAIVLLYVLAGLACFNVFTLVLPILVGQVLDFITYAPELFGSLQKFVQEHIPLEMLTNTLLRIHNTFHWNPFYMPIYIELGS